MLAAALAALLASPAAARPPVPRPDTPEESAPRDFRGDPARSDLRSMVDHLGAVIAGPSGRGTASVDEFVTGLEEQLRRGNDVPRDRILRNAALAREHLRLAYNDLAEAAAPELLPLSAAELKALAEDLEPALGRNRDSVGRLLSAADSARATVSAMVLAPPESPGAPVPVASLSFIEPLRGELLGQSARLKKAAKGLRRAKALAARAKEHREAVRGLAELAGKLDEEALGHLNERRTRAKPEQYRTRMLSREVILNAERWLAGAVEKAEALTAALEAQLDPRREGVRRALDRSLSADARTQDGKELQTRSGNRINYNHKMRLNGVIRAGWETASDARRPWWVGRARMAKDEGREDSARMDEAQREAERAASAAEADLRAASEALARLAEAAGRADERPPKLVKRVLDVPEPRDVKGRPGPRGERVRSKPLKIPRTLEVSDGEIIQSYDGR